MLGLGILIATLVVIALMGAVPPPLRMKSVFLGDKYDPGVNVPEGVVEQNGLYTGAHIVNAAGKTVTVNSGDYVVRDPQGNAHVYTPAKYAEMFETIPDGELDLKAQVEALSGQAQTVNDQAATIALQEKQIEELKAEKELVEKSLATEQATSGDLLAKCNELLAEVGRPLLTLPGESEDVPLPLDLEPAPVASGGDAGDEQASTTQ